MVRFFAVVLCAGAAAICVAAAPAGAVSGPAAAHLGDEQGDNGASFDNAPTDLRGLDVTWDGQKLTVAATYQQTPPDYSLDLLISSAPSVDEADTCDLDAAETVLVTAYPNGSADLQVPGIDGALEATATHDGNRMSIAFSDATLTDYLSDESTDPFTCLSGSADGDEFFGVFDGKQLAITPALAADAVRQQLRARFGRSAADSSRTWIRCPEAEHGQATSDQPEWTVCRYRFPVAGGWRAGGGRVELFSGVLDASEITTGPKFSMRERRCTGVSARLHFLGVVLTGRRLSATGALGRPSTCRWLLGGAGPAKDLQYRAVHRYPAPLLRYTAYLHGTNLAGFGAVAAFPCHLERRAHTLSARCTNQLGDRFTYRFTIRRR